MGAVLDANGSGERGRVSNPPLRFWLEKVPRFERLGVRRRVGIFAGRGVTGLLDFSGV